MTQDPPSLNGAGHGPADDEINLRDAWNLLLRNWLVIGLAVVVTVGAAWFYSSMTVPVYESVATLRIEEDNGPNVPVLDILQDLSAGSEVETEMEVLRSRILAEAVVDSLGLKLRPSHPKGVGRSSVVAGLFIEPWSPAATYRLVRTGDAFEIEDMVSGEQFGSVSERERGSVPGASFLMAEGAAQRYEEIHLEMVGFATAVEGVRRDVAISRPNRDASIITLRYRSTDTLLVSAVPNLLARSFMDRRQEVQTTGARSTVAFLEEQIDTLESQLAEAEDLLVAFEQDQQVVSLGAEADAQVTQLANLQAQRFQVENDRQTLQDLVNEVEAQAQSGDELAPSPYRRLIAFPPLLQNQGVGQLLNQLNTLSTARTELLRQRLPADPDVQNLTEQIQGIEDQLRDLSLGLLRSLNSQVANLDRQLEGFQEELERIPEQRLNQLRLQRETEVLGSVYTLLSNRLEEARIVTAIEDPSVRIVDPAILPPNPVSPRTLLNLLLGIVLGGVLGVGIAATREFMDDTIHTREDIMKATGNAPILGMIPRISGKAAAAISATGDTGHLEDRLVAGRDPRNPVSEAYRSLRTNLTFSNPDDPPRVVVFTSPLPRDGKSTSASNLAITLAQQGHLTLLVDADLRRGVLNNVFGCDREPGLSNVLAGHAKIDEAIHEVRLGHSGSIHFMPSGPFPPNPAELLGSGRMRTLIDELETRYDFVLLDSAPLTIVTDAAVLGTKVDGVVLIARANRTEKGALTYAVEQLHNVRAPVLGTVLNDVDYRRDSRYSSRYGRYGYYYQYYYGEDGQRKDAKDRDPKRTRMGERT
jgi:tyrosine-protein kinase Etk/Wzc